MITDEVKQPGWLLLPADNLEPEVDIYWSCFGTHNNSTEDLDNEIPFWDVAYITKEEAQASCFVAQEGIGGWVWDGLPAQSFPLVDLLQEARQNRAKGVEIRGYRNGEWVCIKRYPVEIPLQESL